MRSAAVLVFVLLALGGCIAPAGPDAGPALLVPGADLHITGEAVWSGVTFLPASSGIEPAARVTVGDGGVLVVTDSTLSQVRIVVEAGGSLFVERSHFLLGAGPVRVHGHGSFHDATLSDSPAGLLRVDGGDAYLTGTELRSSAGDGVLVEGGFLSVEGGVWRNVTGYGVFASDSRVHLLEVDAEDTLEYGVRAEGGTLEVVGGHFIQECGVYVRGGHATVRDVAFDTSGHGVTAFDATLEVRDSTFAGAKQAVLLSNSTATLSGLRVQDALFAVDAFGGTTNLTGSYLSAGEVAVRARGGVLEMHHDDLVGPGLGVDAQDARVEAPWNWWGGDPPVVEVAGFERTTWLDAPATGERPDA